MTVLVSTAYIDEAAHCDWLVAMDHGRVLASATIEELRSKTGAQDLDAVFIALQHGGIYSRAVGHPARRRRKRRSS